jgi:hypothetical protein
VVCEPTALVQDVAVERVLELEHIAGLADRVHNTATVHAAGHEYPFRYQECPAPGHGERPRATALVASVEV